MPNKLYRICLWKFVEKAVKISSIFFRRRHLMNSVTPSQKLQARNPATMAIDFSAMEPIPHPTASLNSMAINVSASGHIALNQKLYDVVVKALPSLTVDFSASPDFTVLAIRSSDTPHYKFPKGGRIKDTAFSRRLVEAGISLPARYEVAWNASADAWVGILTGGVQDSPQAALSKSLKATAKNSKKG
jgi:hypothetical protein